MLISTGGMQSKSKVAAVDMRRRRAAALKMFPNYYTSCFYRLRKQELPVEVRSQSSAPTLSCTPGLISSCLLSWRLLVKCLYPDPPPHILLSRLTSVSCWDQTFCIWHCVDQWGFLSSLSWPFGVSSVSILSKWCRELLSRRMWTVDVSTTKRFVIKGTLYKGQTTHLFSYLTNLFPFQDCRFYYLIIIVIGCF